MDVELHIDTHLIDLVRADDVFFSSDFTQYSVTQLQGYRKWSDLMSNSFKGYVLDKFNVF